MENNNEINEYVNFVRDKIEKAKQLRDYELSDALQSNETHITIRRDSYIESINTKVDIIELLANEFIKRIEEIPDIAAENMQDVIEKCNNIATLNELYSNFVDEKGLVLEFNQYAMVRLRQ